MEIVGAVSSSIALAGAAAQVSRKSATLYLDLRDAPTELASLRSSLRRTEMLLEQIAITRVSGFIPQDFQKALQEALVDLEQAITEIRSNYRKYATDKPSKRACVKWAMASSHLIEKNEQRIQSALAYFNTMLSLAGLRETQAISRKISRAETILSDIQPAVGEPTKPLWIESKHPSGGQLGWVVRARRLAPWLMFLGLSGSLVSVRAHDSQKSSVSVQFRIPWRRTKRASIIIVDFLIHKTFRPWRIFPGVSRGVMATNVIPETAEINLACLTGDLKKVRQLLRNGQANLHDVTAGNLSLLYFAIEGGNTLIVQYLLESGANPNWTFGSNQTSPLQWALYKGQLGIASTLVNHNADRDHISAMGWDPMMYLLEGARRQHFAVPYTATPSDAVSAIDMTFFSLKVRQDPEDCVLHLQAQRGATLEFHCYYDLTPEGSISESTAKMSWRDLGSPMHFAIVSGDLDTFLKLLPYYEEDLDQEDERSVSMLGYAARYGRSHIVRHLVGLGAEEVYAELPVVNKNEGYGNEPGWTDSIADWSVETYHSYIGVLEDLRLVEIRDEQDENELERVIYWNSNESPS